MGERGSPPMDAKGSRMIPIFIDTNLDTHMLLSASPSETVGDLRGKIMNGHLSCFPHLSNINIGALMVKRKSMFYHLVDSMLVESAFHGLKGNRFLLVEVSQPDSKPVQAPPRPNIMKLETGSLLKNDYSLGLQTKDTSTWNNSSSKPVTMSISDSFMYRKQSSFALHGTHTSKTCSLDLQRGKALPDSSHRHCITVQDCISQPMHDPEVSALATVKTGKNIEGGRNSPPLSINDTDKETGVSKSFKRSEVPEHFDGECNGTVTDAQTGKSAKQEKDKSVVECSNVQDVCGQFSNNMQSQDAITVREETASRKEAVAKESEALGRGDETFEILKTFENGDVQRQCNKKFNGNTSNAQTDKLAKRKKGKSVVGCSPVQEGCGQLINNMQCQDAITIEEDKALRNEGISKESENLCSGNETFVPSGKEKSKKKRREELYDINEGLSGQALPRSVEEHKKKRKRKERHDISECLSEQVLGQIETEKDFPTGQKSSLEKLTVFKPTKENNDTDVKKTVEGTSSKQQELLGGDAEDDHLPGRYLSLEKKGDNSSTVFEEEHSPNTAGKDLKGLQVKGDAQECNIEKKVKHKRKRSSKFAIVNDDQEVSAADVNKEPKTNKHKRVLENNCGKAEETTGASAALEEDAEAMVAACVPVKRMDISSEKENDGQFKTSGKKKKKRLSNDPYVADNPDRIAKENVSKNNIIGNSCKDAVEENAPDTQNGNTTNAFDGNDAVTYPYMKKSKKNITRDLDGNMDSQGTAIMKHTVSPGTTRQQPSGKEIEAENRTPGLWDNESKKMKRSKKGLPSNEMSRGTNTGRIAVEGSASKPDRSIAKMESNTNISPKILLPVSTELENDKTQARGSISGVEKERHICNDSIIGNGNIEKCDDQRKEVKCSKNSTSKSSQIRAVSIENGVMDKVVVKAGNSGHHGKKEMKKTKNVYVSSESIVPHRNINADLGHKYKQVQSSAACDCSDTSQSSKYLQGNDHSVKMQQSADQNLASQRDSFKDIGSKIRQTENSDRSDGSDTINTSLPSGQMQNTDCGALKHQSAVENIVQKSMQFGHSTASDHSNTSKPQKEQQASANLTGKLHPANQMDSPERNIIENMLKQADSSDTRDICDTSQPAEKRSHGFATQQPHPKCEGLVSGKNNTVDICRRQKQALGSLSTDGSGNSQSSQERNNSDSAMEKPDHMGKFHDDFILDNAKSKDTGSRRQKKSQDNAKHAEKNKLSLFKSISDESTEEEDSLNDLCSGSSSSTSFSNDSSDSLNSDAGSRDKVSKSQSIKTQADWEPSTSGALLSTALGMKQRDFGGSGPIQSKFAHLISKKTGLGELFRIAREQQKVDCENFGGQFMATESPSVDIVLETQETQESQIDLVHTTQNNQQEVGVSPMAGKMKGDGKLLKDKATNAISSTKSCPDINKKSSGKRNSLPLAENLVHSSDQLKTPGNGMPQGQQTEPDFKKPALIEPQIKSSGKKKRGR